MREIARALLGMTTRNKRYVSCATTPPPPNKSRIISFTKIVQLFRYLSTSLSLSFSLPLPPSLKKTKIFEPAKQFQIYGAVIGGHLSSFPSDIRRFGGPVLEATISLHRSVCSKFLPTAIKFYYGFNLRDLSCLVQVRRVICIYRR